jgi:predicted polyphosphate/ATP-dependent NAD kinase
VQNIKARKVGERLQRDRLPAELINSDSTCRTIATQLKLKSNFEKHLQSDRKAIGLRIISDCIAIAGGDGTLEAAAKRSQSD